MSLVRIALRIAGVQALRGKTDVGDNVLDSQIGAIDVGSDHSIRTDQKKPFLALYTDSARAGTGQGAPAGSRLDARSLMMNGAIEIVIEAGVTAAMVVRDPDTEEALLEGIGVPALDRNLEAQLDIIMRQACNALTDPDDEWADIFRSLTYGYTRLERSRAATPEGQRIAAHQLRITTELVEDPLPGEPLDPQGGMARFIAKAAILGDPDVDAIVSRIVALSGGDDPDWKVKQRRHGMTRAELLALGYGPVVQDEDRLTPEHTETVVDVDHVGTIVIPAEEDAP